MAAPHSVPNPTSYALGFGFTRRHGYPGVYLIRKEKPEWQKGLLNGIGGKIEPGERPIDAMVREYNEETGVFVERIRWHPFFVMRFENGAIVHCFACDVPDELTPTTMESEHVNLYEIGKLGAWYKMRQIVPNLTWLIPMAYQELHVAPSERMISYS